MKTKKSNLSETELEQMIHESMLDLTAMDEWLEFKKNIVEITVRFGKKPAEVYAKQEIIKFVNKANQMHHEFDNK